MHQGNAGQVAVSALDGITCNHKAVPQRDFNELRDWASDRVLADLRETMLTELLWIHPQVQSLAAARNGLRSVEAEIQRRIEVEKI